MVVYRGQRRERPLPVLVDRRCRPRQPERLHPGTDRERRPGRLLHPGDQRPPRHLPDRGRPSARRCGGPAPTPRPTRTSPRSSCRRPGPAPPAAGDPSAYLDTTHGVSVVVYRADDAHIHSLYWSDGPVGHDDLSGYVGTPNAAGDPVGYYIPGLDAHQVTYRGVDGHLYEIWWVGEAPRQRLGPHRRRRGAAGECRSGGLLRRRHQHQARRLPRSLRSPLRDPLDAGQHADLRRSHALGAWPRERPPTGPSVARRLVDAPRRLSRHRRPGARDPLAGAPERLALVQHVPGPVLRPRGRRVPLPRWRHPRHRRTRSAWTTGSRSTCRPSRITRPTGAGAAGARACSSVPAPPCRTARPAASTRPAAESGSFDYSLPHSAAGRRQPPERLALVQQVPGPVLRAAAWPARSVRRAARTRDRRRAGALTTPVPCSGATGAGSGTGSRVDPTTSADAAPGSRPAATAPP